MSNSWIDSGDGTGIYCDADADNNLLQLKLKKPSAWKWELTTSRSSPNISMPRIMLFNHKGDLLVDANQQVDDAVYRQEKKPPRPPPKRRTKKLLRAVTTNLERSLQEDEDTGLGSLDSAERNTFRPQNNLQHIEKPMNHRNIPDVTRTIVLGEKKVNGYRPWRNSVPDEIDFGSLQICEATDSDRSPQSSVKSSIQPEEDVNINTPWRRKWSLKEKSIEPPKLNRKQLESNRPIEPTICSDFDNSPDRLYVSKASWKPFHSNGHLNEPPQPLTPFDRRASSFKEVRFKVHPASDDEEQKPKEKRRYRRSNTSGKPPLAHSGSILERLSAMKCRMSSPEFETAESHKIQMGPRYFLRTSRAGTIVVAEEPLKTRRVRRRQPKTSSTENFLSPSSSKTNSSFNQGGLLSPNLGVPAAQSQSMNNFSELSGNRQRRKVIPIRRNRSDGNILLATSSDEGNDGRGKPSVKHRKNGSWRQIKGGEDAGILTTPKESQTTSSTTTVRPTIRTTTTTLPFWLRPTTSSTSTSTTVRPWISYPTFQPTTTTTVRPWYTIPTTTTTTTPEPTTTELLPLLPDIEPEEDNGEEYEDEDEEDQDAEEGVGNTEDNEIFDQDENYPTDDTNPDDPYEEEPTEEPAEESTEETPSEFDVVTSEPLIQEPSTTVKKAKVFGWF